MEYIKGNQVFYAYGDYYWVDIAAINNFQEKLFDLIEVGDIVELEYYVAKYRRRISRKFECQILENKVIYFDNRHCSFCYDFELKKWRDGEGYNPKIKTILSHEQYRINCYKGG